MHHQCSGHQMNALLLLLLHLLLLDCLGWLPKAVQVCFGNCSNNIHPTGHWWDPGSGSLARPSGWCRGSRLVRRLAERWVMLRRGQDSLFRIALPQSCQGGKEGILACWAMQFDWQRLWCRLQFLTLDSSCRLAHGKTQELLQSSHGSELPSLPATRMQDLKVYKQLQKKDKRSKG